MDSETREKDTPWIRTQKNTFTNWVNDKLKSEDVQVEDITLDLRDGVNLCKLVSVLKGESIGKIIKKTRNHYQATANVAMALEAMKKDKVNLVNIGADDITNGNQKLILGVMWALIRRYQIGSKGRLPAKKIMLAWINAVLYPHLDITNFTSDWNNGIALCGLIDYCSPGTFPDWHQLPRHDKLANCETAMSTANELFEIPLVVSPENMASSGGLDELSCMTYLSYFMARHAPGYNATLNWVKQQIDPEEVNNFTTDWHNGMVISHLVHSLGGSIPGWPDIDMSDGQRLCTRAIAISNKDLGVPGFINAKDMTQENNDHIAVMAYAEWHRAITGGKPVQPRASPVPLPVTNHDPDPEPVLVTNTHREEQNGDLSDSDEAEPPPVPPHPKSESDEGITLLIKDMWRINTALTSHINVADDNNSSRTFQVRVKSPGGKERMLPVTHSDDNVYDFAYTPDEKGVWMIEVLEEDEHVNGSPHRTTVYDSSLVEIVKQFRGPLYVGKPTFFQVQTANAYCDNVSVHVLHEGLSTPTSISRDQPHSHTVSFTPDAPGKYTASVYVGGAEVPGSPFSVEAELAGDVIIRGKGLRTGVQGQRVEFILDTTTDRDGPLAILITGLGGANIEPDINKVNDIFKISYVPPEPGLYKIEVIYNNVPVQGSPFRPNIEAPKQIYVIGMPYETVRNQSYSFIVDAAEVVKGTLEIDSDLPVLNYEKEGDKKYKITFIPRKAGRHDIIIKYNKEIIADSPYNVIVR